MKARIINNQIDALTSVPGTLGCLKPETAVTFLFGETFQMISWNSAAKIMIWLLKYYPAFFSISMHAGLIADAMKDGSLTQDVRTSLTQLRVINCLFQNQPLSEAEKGLVQSLDVNEVTRIANLTNPASTYTAEDRARVLKIIQFSNETGLSTYPDLQTFLQVDAYLLPDIVSRLRQQNQLLFTMLPANQDEQFRVAAHVVSDPILRNIDLNKAVTHFKNPAVRKLLSENSCLDFLATCLKDDRLDRFALLDSIVNEDYVVKLKLGTQLDGESGRTARRALGQFFLQQRKYDEAVYWFFISTDIYDPQELELFNDLKNIRFVNHTTKD